MKNKTCRLCSQPNILLHAVCESCYNKTKNSILSTPRMAEWIRKEINTKIDISIKCKEGDIVKARGKYCVIDFVYYTNVTVIPASNPSDIFSVSKRLITPILAVKDMDNDFTRGIRTSLLFKEPNIFDIVKQVKNSRPH